MDKKQVLQDIYVAYERYQQNLVNNIFTYLYFDKGEVKTKTVGFTPDNFLHLTGVKSRLSGRDFAKEIRRNNLVERDINLRDIRKVKSKMAVISRIPELVSSDCKIADKNTEFETVQYIIGKDGIMLGFLSGQPFDKPSTLLTGCMGKIVHNEREVMAILAMPKDGKKINNQVLYIKDGIKIDSKELPQIIVKRSTQDVLTALANGEKLVYKNSDETPKLRTQNDDKAKSFVTEDGKLDLIAVTMEQCGAKLDAEIAPAKRTQKETASQQGSQVGQSRQVEQVGQVGQVQQVRKGKTKTKEKKDNSGKR